MILDDGHAGAVVSWLWRERLCKPHDHFLSVHSPVFFGIYFFSCAFVTVGFSFVVSFTLLRLATFVGVSLLLAHGVNMPINFLITYKVMGGLLSILPWIRLRAYRTDYERCVAVLGDAKKLGIDVSDLPQVLEQFKSEIDEFESQFSNKPRRDLDFPRMWSLFAYILPRETRNRVFEPYHQEMLEDYVISRRSYRTKFARRWLKFAFAFRTALMVGECLWVMGADRLFRWVGRIVAAFWWCR